MTASPGRQLHSPPQASVCLRRYLSSLRQSDSHSHTALRLLLCVWSCDISKVSSPLNFFYHFSCELLREESIWSIKKTFKTFPLSSTTVLELHNHDPLTLSVNHFPKHTAKSSDAAPTLKQKVIVIFAAWHFLLKMSLVCRVTSLLATIQGQHTDVLILNEQCIHKT